MQLAAWVGGVVGTVEVAFWRIDGSPMWLLLALVAYLASAVSIFQLRTPQPQVAPVLIVAMVGLAVVAPALPPLAAGSLMLGPITFGAVAGIILPDPVMRWVLAVACGTVLSQLTWPLFTEISIRDAGASFIIQCAVATMAFAVVTVARRSMADSDAVRINLFQRVPIGLFRADRSGAFVDANPALATMLGHMEVSELLDRNIADVVPDKELKRDLLRRLDESDAPQRMALRMVRADGTTIWARGFCKAIRDRRGEVIYYEGAVEDITQRRRAEEASKISEERFRNVFTRSPVALWEEDFTAVGEALETLRRTGISNLAAYLANRPEEVRRLIGLVRFTDVNPAGVAMVGAPTRGHLLAGIPAEEIDQHVAASFTQQFLAVWEGRTSAVIETKGRRADGSRFDCIVHWAAPSANNRLLLERVVVAIVDVTRQKAVEADLNALLSSKDDLIASVSHELRTPITSVLGLSTVLRDSMDEFDDDEQHELIGLIADQSRELANIVEDLLVAARAEQDAIAVRVEAVDLDDEIRTVIASADAIAPRLVGLENPPVRADPLRLRQILRNLLSNAARYGGPDVEIEVRPGPDHVEIVVSDDGDGVAPADVETIFQPYRRARRVAGLPASLGLGLAVSRRLARLMDGDLTYEDGERTAFVLRLPLAEVESAA